MKRSSLWRKLAFWTHLWVGVALGIPLAAIGITGSFLVFGPELERVIYPQFMLSPDAKPNAHPMSWGQFEEHLAAKFPLETVTYIHRTPQHNDAFLVTVKERTEWFPFDAFSGRALGTYQYEGTFLDWLYKIHIELVAGENGIFVAGVSGLFLVWLCATGVLLWWPRHLKNLKSALTIHWKAGWKRKNWDLHVVGGTLAALVLAVLGYTGAMYNLPAVEEKTKAVLVREKTPETPKSKPFSGAHSLSLAQVEKAALQAFPGAQIVALNLPSERDGTFNARLRQSGEAYRYGDTRVVLDRYSGAVLQTQNGLSPRGGEAVDVWQSRLHFGHFGGLTTQLLYILVGVLPAFLWVSGLVMWWNRALAPRLRKNARRRQKEGESSSVKAEVTA